MVGLSPAEHLLGVEDPGAGEGMKCPVRGERHHLLAPTPRAAPALRLDGRGVDRPRRGGNILDTLQGGATEQGGPPLTKPVALDTVNLPVAN